MKKGQIQERAHAVAVDATISPKEKIAESAAAGTGEPDAGGGPRLLFFFILIAQLSDALQYAWSQLPNKHVIVPAINTTRTWEGLLGGTASVMLIGELCGGPRPLAVPTGGCRP